MKPLLEIDEPEKPICLVTGASSGIGLATAVLLSRHSERLGLICRSESRGRAACDAIQRANPRAGPIDLWLADLASLSSVRKVARAIRASYTRVDVLVNNAGAVFSRREISEDGLEMHLATNYAGHFLLTALLIDKLSLSIRPRVVTISSSLYKLGRLRLDDLAFSRPYHLVFGYAQSKLAGVLFMRELARRPRRVPILANCVDPGFVRTGIYRGAIGHQRWLARYCENFGRDPGESGALIERLVMDREFHGISGRYFAARGERALNPRARDPQAAEALWQRSLGWLTPTEAACLQAIDPT